MKRIACLLILVACGGPPVTGDDDSSPDAGGDDDDDVDAAPDACADDACLIDLHDQVKDTCEAGAVAELVAALEARRGDWPLWSGGRALFVTDEPRQVAGAFNDWRSDADATTSLCGSGLSTAIVAVATGRWPYKLVAGDQWTLDPGNWGFAFDDFEGNADGKNSVINTYDSGLGHLVQPPEALCSSALDNCRMLTAYLPAGYRDPANAARRYPVVFMHDGQNIFDDHDCCFGHTGWEVNVQMDGDVAAGLVEPAIIVGADHAGVARGDEYGWSTSVGGAQETFMAFQVETIQPTAAERWRLDDARVYVAGSSLGGLISMRLALAYPEVYAGAASISGAFWPGQDTDTALRDVLAGVGKVDVDVYLDSGGGPGGGDGYDDTIEIRDMMMTLGWERITYHWEEGATHDELAWKARAWRFLRFFIGQ